MLSHLLFKIGRNLPAGCLGLSLSFLVIVALSGCGRAPCKITGSDRGNAGLCGPVRSVLLEMGGGGGDSIALPSAAVYPREYRGFDREGRLILWVEFGKNIADTLSLMHRYYNGDGLCVKTLQGRPGTGTQKRWSWERVEYEYDESKQLLWQAEFRDTVDLVPHTVFCYSSNREEEAECLGRWKSVATLKIVYQNKQGVPQGEQWRLNGTGYGAIRYDVDTTFSRGNRYVRYRLPAQNVVNKLHRYVANFYDDAGRLIEQWGYLRQSLTEGTYSYADLAEILRFDSLGRTIFQLSVGNDTASRMYRMAFQFDERGNLLKRIRTTYASFSAFMQGKTLEERVEDRFEYGGKDKYGNWTFGATKGERGGVRGVLRRTIEYY